MNPRFNVARVKGRQRGLGHQLTVVHQRQSVRGAQPVRRLRIGHDVHMAVLREKFLQRPQAVAQFMVVPKAALHIAVTRHGRARVAGQLRQSSLALGSPARIVAVHPQINHVNRLVGQMVHASVRWVCGHSGGGAGSGGSEIFQAASLSAGHERIFNTHPGVGATDLKGRQSPITQGAPARATAAH